MVETKIKLLLWLTFFGGFVWLVMGTVYVVGPITRNFIVWLSIVFFPYYGMVLSSAIEYCRRFENELII
jgi:hypothetical protein